MAELKEAPSQECAAPASWLQALAEVAVLVVACFLLSGGPPPGINEAHYLAKARHYWNPEWCAGDFFLESADAHLAFYWAFGWVTRFCSLPATAWIGRVLCWVLLAASWQRLSWAVAPRPWYAVVFGLLFLVTMQWLPMAGEWVVGGVEAKGLAFPLLLAGLEAVVRGHWRAAWLWLGAASAFHVLVGGWGVIAAGIAWLITTPDRRASLAQMTPGLVGGLLFALPGLVPAVLLTWGVPGEIVTEANDVYVHQRLLHHLRLAGFPVERILLFAAGTIAWLALAVYFPAKEGEVRLRAFVVGALWIAVAGLILDIGFSLADDRYRAAAVLRYYWYRLADVAIPLGLALGAAAVVSRWEREQRAVAAQCALCCALVFGLLGGAWSLFEQGRPDRHGQRYLPPADAQGGVQSLDDWRRVCGWLRDNTHPEARVLTPPYHFTFKWYAERAEVVNWKDQPQDAVGIVAWWERLLALYSERGPDGAYRWRESASDIPTEELIRAARELGYDFQYVLVETRHGAPKFHLRQVYPHRFEPNATFVVYEMPR